jgi:hypothetical protein
MPKIGGAHLRASTIGEDGVVLADALPERIVRVTVDTADCCGSIHVPEDDGFGSFEFEHGTFQQFVIHAEAAVFDYNVGMAGIVKHSGYIDAGTVHDGTDIGVVMLIAMLLAGVGVRLGKGNVVAPLREILINAAIVSGGPVPVRGNYAGSKDKDIH